MTKFTRSLYSTSALGVALALASPAYAQAAPEPAAPAAAPTATDDKDAIVVTGFRAALRSATARKKKAETVVESVSSEDIGKLPDNSIGESIARLPGLASQRSAGRANIISIRGFGPDFSTTTLNGRQQTTSNDSRAVEFDQYPSEVLAGVDVYKTTESDHTAGGLVGNIDLRTIRPLEVAKRILAVGARGVLVDQKLQPNSKDKGFRVFGTYVDQFADGRVGVALSAAYTSDPYQTRDWNAWGYGGYPGGGQGMNGVKSWFESDQLKRFGTNATIEAKLSDNLTMSVDGFYSKFTDNVDKRGWEMPFNCGGYCGHDQIVSSTVTNGLVTAATIRGTPVIENYAIDRKTDQISLGWNAKWDGHNGWRGLVDLSYSKTKRRDHNLETTAGLGRALPNATATISYTFTDKGPIFVSDYNGASSALVLTDVEGWSGSPVQAGYDKVRKSNDDLKEARAEIEREVGGLVKSIKVGVDYTDRSKVVTQTEATLSPPNGALTAAIPANLLLTPFTLDRGLGPILSFDPRAALAAGVLSFIPNTYGASQGYNLTEKVWTPYAMAPLDGDFGSVHLTGNIGVQGIHTSVRSAGFAKPSITDSYWMVLPSLNLNFRFANDVVVRFAAAKQMMRPRLDQLNNNVGFGINNTFTPPIYTGGGGNPLLRPYQAKAVDLTIEKYFGSKGYIALQSFYKHLDTYIDQQATSTTFDYSGFPVPSGNVPSSPIGNFNGPVNTSGGKLYGVELAGTLQFETFSRVLSGFGLTGGVGYTKTSVKRYNGTTTPIPGYSKFVANVTAFYEGDGFSARGSLRHRSGFLGDFVAFNGNFDQQYVLAEDIYDAQLGYDFPKGSTLGGLSVYLQGQNLSNERQATIGVVSLPQSWLKYQTYGRRFLAGFTYKF
jgi:iron complex outermembrane receptor protein